jgi:hypothetical protein
MLVDDDDPGLYLVIGRRGWGRRRRVSRLMGLSFGELRGEIL